MNKRLAVVWGSHPALFENRVIDAEICLRHLPQDQRSGCDPYPDIPPLNECWAVDFDRVESCGVSDFVFTVSSVSMLGGLIGTLLRSIESIGSFLELSGKDLCDLTESLCFTASRGLVLGIFRLRADALVG